MPSETRLAFRTAFSRSDRFRRTCSKSVQRQSVKTSVRISHPACRKSGISLEIRFKRQTAARNRYSARTAHEFENGGLSLGAQGIDAVTAVNISDFAGNAGRQVGQQEGGSIPDFFDGNVAAQRVVGGDVSQEFAEIGDAGGGERFDQAAEMPLQRMPSLPRQAAVKRMPASRLAFAIPITL